MGSSTAQRRLANLADGVNATDAVTLRQSQAQAAQTLSQANAYTDSRIGALSDDFEHQIGSIRDRLDGVGAMSAAQAAMAMNAAGQGANLHDRLLVGLGAYRSGGALAVGYSHSFDDRRAFSLSAATSGHEAMGGMSFGFAW